MKTIGDEYIRRVVGNEGNGGASGGGGGGASTGWVGSNFLSIEFFNQLFALHYQKDVVVMNGEEEISPHIITEYDAAPNAIITEGTETETDSTTGYTTITVTTIIGIRANHGFWSNSFVSALGQGTGGGGGGGISMSDVWTALAASTSEQINASHLSDALNGYATQQWVGQQGFLTSSAISDMATKTWVGQQGYITSSAISDMATKTWVGQQGFLTSSALNGYATQSWVGQQGFLTGITSSMVTTALGFTPLSNATTFWGSGVSNGVVNGSITMQNGTGNGIYQKDVGGTARRVLSMDGATPSGLYIGMDMLGYSTTFIRGNNISFTVGSSPGTDAMEITSAGRVYVKQGAQGLRIGDALLTWDATNKVLNLTNVTTGQVAHFVASGGVTALQTS